MKKLIQSFIRVPNLKNNVLLCLMRTKDIRMGGSIVLAQQGPSQTYSCKKPCLSSKDELPHSPGDDGEDSPDQLDGGDCGQEDKPEPEQDVNLERKYYK